MSRAANRPGDESQDERIEFLNVAGYSLSEIAERTGKTIAGVKYRFMRLGLDLPAGRRGPKRKPEAA